LEQLSHSADGKVLVTGSGNTFTVWDWDGKAGLKERHSDQAEESQFVTAAPTVARGRRARRAAVGVGVPFISSV
jgi:hypothetical protein